MKYMFETNKEITVCAECNLLEIEDCYTCYCGIVMELMSYKEAREIKPNWCPLQKVEE